MQSCVWSGLGPRTPRRDALSSYHIERSIAASSAGKVEVTADAFTPIDMPQKFPVVQRKVKVGTSVHRYVKISGPEAMLQGSLLTSTTPGLN